MHLYRLIPQAVRHCQIRKAIGYISIITGLMFAGCFECDSDEFLGKLDLLKETWEHYPYSNVDALVFQNSDKDTLVLRKRQFLHDYNPSIITRPCYKSPLDQTNAYYMTEFLRVYYSRRIDSMNVSISYTLQIENTEKFLNGKFTPVDMLRTDATFNGDAIGNIHLLINNRDQTPDSTWIKNTERRSPIQYHDTFTLNSTIYSDVYSSKHNTGSEIYYTKTQGVIGFITDNGLIYNLSDIITSGTIK